MARIYFVFGAILLWGIVQADVLSENGPAFIENIRGASSRIVGGWPAEEGQFPHQVSLRMVTGTGATYSCGGSIIHNEWVLTAAHCVANIVTFVVRIGLTNVTRPEYIVEAYQKYSHPSYIELFAAIVQPNDIGLVKLEQYINYGPNIQPCRLQNSESKDTNYEGVVLAVSGYGMTDDASNGGTSSEVLRWTHLRGITNAECLDWYQTSWIIRDSTICAEFYNDTAQSSCQGDSGGPLIVPDVDGKPTMVGIVSFGHASGCNGPYPSAYIRPGHYHDWITEVTGIDFDWKSADLVPASAIDTPSAIDNPSAIDDKYAHGVNVANM